MLTCGGRFSFFQQALRYFQAQSYPNTELIIIDDSPPGREHRGMHVPLQPNIVYTHFDSARQLSIGAKRNLALSIAEGELICMFDDDDIYHENRLIQQALPILSGDASVTALKMNLVLHVQTGKLWRISDRLHFRLFPHDVKAGTVMFTKSAARNLSYPNVSLGEDAWFLNRLLKHGGRLEQVVDPHSYICVRHGGNVSPEMEYGPPEWSEERVEEYLSTDEIAFYEGMRKEQGVAKNA